MTNKVEKKHNPNTQHLWKFWRFWFFGLNYTFLLFFRKEFCGNFRNLRKTTETLGSMYFNLKNQKRQNMTTLKNSGWAAGYQINLANCKIV